MRRVALFRDELSNRRESRLIRSVLKKGPFFETNALQAVELFVVGDHSEETALQARANGGDFGSEPGVRSAPLSCWAQALRQVEIFSAAFRPIASCLRVGRTQA